MVLRRTLAVAALGSALALSACAGDPAPSSATASGSAASGGAAKAIVIDTSFDLKTADPGREFEPTGGIVVKALYQTLITFAGADVTKPVPGLADFTMSADQKVLTLKLKPGQVFSDGTPITADDAVFSLQRVQGIKGNPSFLLDGVTVAKVDDSTLTLTSPAPNPQLVYILPNPALGVLNAKAVKAQGGSTGADDKAEQWLNSHSAGSGPYVLDSLDVKSQVKLVANDKFTGTKPAFGTVVLRNVASDTQKLNVQAGDSQIALDLNPDQAAGIDATKAKLTSGPSTYVIFLLLNQDPAIGKVTANPDFIAAVRKGVDYAKVVSLAGKGAVQPGGVIPSMFLGALGSDAAPTRDLAAAKASLAKSGYTGEPVSLSFANDLTPQGLSLQTIAAAVQAQLKEVGITVQLKPAPVASELDAYRGGKEQVGLWYWGPDYPDPADYLAFAPGQTVGKRAGWAAGKDAAVDAATAKASSATGDARAAAYQDWQKAMNATSPFLPLVQPAQNVAAAPSLTSLGLNPVWIIDVAAIS